MHPGQERPGDREANGLGSFEVDGEMESVELPDRKIPRVSAEKNTLLAKSWPTMW